MESRRCWCGGILKPCAHPSYYECQNCKTFIVKDIPSRQKLENFYTFDGYWNDYVTNKFGYPSIQERAEVDFRDRIPIWFKILKIFKPNTESLLEIGCAHGGFLYFCKENGVKNVVGIEVDKKTCEFAKNKFNLKEIIPGLFPDVDLPIEKFDVVAGFDVLEHFTDPLKALKHVAKILNEDGICIFQTPNYKGEGEKWLHFKPEEHLFLFNEQNIYLLFDRAGLDIIEILPGIIREDMIVIAKRKINVDDIELKPTDYKSSFKNSIKPLKIGIGLVEHMGDIIACEPVSRYLRAKYPDAHITWCVREEYEELINPNPYIDETLVVNCLTEWIELKRSSIFDKVVDLHIHGRICPTCDIPLNNINGKVIVTAENYYFLGSLLSAFSRSAGLPSIDGKPRVYITKQAKDKVDSLNLPLKYIVFHCSSNEKSRDWIDKNWVKLAEHILKKHKLSIVEVGTESILQKYNFNDFINLCGKTTILETAEVIRRSLLFIGVDSGPAHIANAVETPGVVLLGHYRNFKRYMPFTGDYANGANVKLIYNDFGPASGIPVGEVINAVDEFISNFEEGGVKVDKNVEIETEFDEVKKEKRAKVIAFFLPQFHPIPENDKWWGKGFTEWRMVATSKPLFPGHYQPRIPADTGFYDLRVPETREMQAELAREYGIDAFCYWHYWFNGKLLLERPLIEILESGKPDFPFCLAWANENWTRRWDGLDNEIIMKQTYGGIMDHVEHFNWLLKFFKDERYFKIEGKPAFLIYRPGQIPDLKDMIKLWRRLAKDNGFDLFLISIKCSADNVSNWRGTGFDGELIFQPFFSIIINFQVIKKGLSLDKISFIFDYTETVNLMSDVNEEFMKQSNNVFACVTPGWDNTARRKRFKPFILTNPSPEIFEKWLRVEIERIQNRKPEHRIVFINAWNEWGEGNYLEPDLKFGHSYLEAIKRAVYDDNRPKNWKGRKFFSLDAESEFTTESLLQFARTMYSENNLILSERYFYLALRYAIKEISRAYHNIRVLNWLGKDNEAKTGIRNLNLLKSLLSQIHNDIAILKYNSNDINSAISHLKESTYHDRNNITAWKNLADIFIERGELEQALSSYREILKIMPDDVETLLNIADICLELGDGQNAEFFYKKVLEVDPKNERAKFRIIQLNNAKRNYLPLVSIIIPVFNQVKHTKLAIESIQKFTNVSYEIIVVDNASTDETKDYLSSLSATIGEVVKVITNPQNYGFPKAVNQGIALSRGEYIVVLNNDVIVTDKWIERLIAHTIDDPTIGIVAPMSNYVSGLQKLDGAEKFYLKGEKVDEISLLKFSEDLYQKNKGQKLIFPRVAGLCMLIKRKVIEIIGGFDERFSPGNFEDDDFCLRTVLAGFKIAIAKDVFIHHFGSKSFNANGREKYIHILKQNEKIFVEKWGAPPTEIFLGKKKPKHNEIFIPLTTNEKNQNAETFTLYDR
ncbi:Glycosyltransferase, GT2 family [Candidatus Kryptobacter tengchongensis]|nr:Glycosyltransferase, GT2 family [Candidatus Kryptobacter tengchongensis]